jgi:phospholipid/cholesterol/gamma-HCH transport system substrate-binding protein
MAKKAINHLKLGIFVITGMLFLVLLLYVIGKNQDLFGKTFVLKARFENVHGLMPGNNIRFAGINAGTVSAVDVVNDTTIEVTLLVKIKMKPYIRKDATVNISTDGLMGNKLVNIIPSGLQAPLVEEGDVLLHSSATDTEEMLAVLNTTNNDVAIIAKELKHTVQRINASEGLWRVLEDETLPVHIRQSLVGIRATAANLSSMSAKLNDIVADVENGRGSAGKLLKDSSIAININDAIIQIRNAGVMADSLFLKIASVVKTLDKNLNEGKGAVKSLLTDASLRQDLEMSIKNIERGSKAFNENMEALKQNFLFRGYFKRKAKEGADSNNF